MTEEQILDKGAESFRKQCLTFRQIHDIRTYQYGYLEATKELQEEIATLKHNKKTVAYLGDCISDIQDKKIAELEKKNEELQEKLDFFLTEKVDGKEYRPKWELEKLQEQIEKMKYVLEKIIKTVHNDCISGYGERLVIINDISCKVLEDVEK